MSLLSGSDVGGQFYGYSICKTLFRVKEITDFRLKQVESCSAKMVVSAVGGLPSHGVTSTHKSPSVARYTLDYFLEKSVSGRKTK